MAFKHINKGQQVYHKKVTSTRQKSNTNINQSSWHSTKQIIIIESLHI